MGSRVLAAVLAAALVSGASGAAWAGKGGDHGPSENAAVMKFCVNEPGFIVTLLFVIRNTDDLKRCLDEGHQPIGVWDVDFFFNLPDQLPAFPGPGPHARGQVNKPPKP